MVVLPSDPGSGSGQWCHRPPPHPTPHLSVQCCTPRLKGQFCSVRARAVKECLLCALLKHPLEIFYVYTHYFLNPNIVIQSKTRPFLGFPLAYVDIIQQLHFTP